MIDLDEIGASEAGWQVNTTRAVAAWAAQRVTPATPGRVFAGAPTFYYLFTDQAAFEAARLAASADLAAADPPRVPGSITMRQARLALLGAGLLTQVNTAVATMPGAQGDAARIEWDASSTVERNKPLVLAMAGVLGLSAAQIDGLFIAGEKL